MRGSKIEPVAPNQDWKVVLNCAFPVRSEMVNCSLTVSTILLGPPALVESEGFQPVLPMPPKLELTVTAGEMLVLAGEATATAPCEASGTAGSLTVEARAGCWGPVTLVRVCGTSEVFT